MSLLAVLVQGIGCEELHLPDSPRVMWPLPRPWSNPPTPPPAPTRHSKGIADLPVPRYEYSTTALRTDGEDEPCGVREDAAKAAVDRLLKDFP